MAVTFEKQSLTLGAAKAGAEAALSRAAKLGLAITVAIVDEAVALKHFSSMDGARAVTRDFALKKAVTAVSTQKPTREYYQFVQQDPQLHAIAHEPNLLLLGGGVPISVGGQVVGAVGISGGHYNQDVECAEAAVAAILAIAEQ